MSKYQYVVTYNVYINTDREMPHEEVEDKAWYVMEQTYVKPLITLHSSSLPNMFKEEERFDEEIKKEINNITIKEHKDVDPIAIFPTGKELDDLTNQGE